MTPNPLKRSDEPIFWLIFGFGGMVITFALPAILICMIIAGFSDGHDGFHLSEVTSHWWGTAALFLIIFGTVFHFSHRFYYSLHDLKIKTTRIHHVILNGFALCVTILSAVILAMHWMA